MFTNFCQARHQLLDNGKPACQQRGVGTHVDHVLAAVNEQRSRLDAGQGVVLPAKVRVFIDDLVANMAQADGVPAPLPA
ncbi:MAG: hypothetical protein FGM55_07645 [Rhodoferax sp.]|nr:hypothetical protein [Rhodoferax sp.]